MRDFPTFTFNGLNSFNDLGIVITEMPPIILPKRDIESIQIEGSNRILHIDKGAYLAISITIKCLLLDNTKLEQLKQVFKASGEIEFSDYPEKIYKCRNVNQIDFSRYANTSFIKEFPLQLELEPIAYGSSIKTINFTEASSFTVGGTENTNPKITVTGTGTITINNISVQFLEDNITLDCENMEATSNNLSKNHKIVLDDFPYLTPGKNKILFSEGITNVEISYKERWL